ncbi:MAG: hypothetical protein FVQ79_12690 [Planctomycetes bacterium]|nr:hypothetical protein [Planctomycetota bacterium]
MTDKDNTLSIAEHGIGFWTKLIYGMYENGKSVSFIATKIGKSEAFIYTKMRRIPEKYEDVKRIRQESENILMRQVRSLVDMTNKRYMEGIWGDSEMAADNIDRVGRIGKEYDRRIQLAEDKATENIEGGGKGGLPFKFVINKHYPSSPDADKDEENDTVEGCAANE